LAQPESFLDYHRKRLDAVAKLKSGLRAVYGIIDPNYRVSGSFRMLVVFMVFDNLKAIRLWHSEARLASKTELGAIFRGLAIANNMTRAYTFSELHTPEQQDYIVTSTAQQASEWFNRRRW
jgi:hypothetical protein